MQRYLTWLVVCSSSLSFLGGTTLAILCTLASLEPSALGSLPLLQTVLAQLGIADAIFSFSFLLAQARNTNSTSGGPACQVASFLNEWGGLTTAWWTIAFAFFVRQALLQGAPLARWTAAARSRLYWRLLPLVWGSTLLYAIAVFAIVYEPRHMLGPQATMPWCHWLLIDSDQDRSALVFSTLFYINIGAALIFVTCTYTDVIIRHHLRAAAARRSLNPAAPALAQVPTDVRARSIDTPLAPQQPMPSPSVSKWSLDVRLASYLGAYVIAQLPSILHRMLQVGSASPKWLADAQVATQPAQGFLNACVFLYHMGYSRINVVGLLDRCGCSRMCRRHSWSWFVCGCCMGCCRRPTDSALYASVSTST